LLICWTESTGEIRDTRSDRVAPDNDRAVIFCESNDEIYDSITVMATGAEKLPDDVDTLKAELAAARARASADQALIAHQQLQIAKLQHQLYGQRSERGARLLGQMELGLEESEAKATEDELAAEQAAARTTNVAAFNHRRSSTASTRRNAVPSTSASTRSTTPPGKVISMRPPGVLALGSGTVWRSWPSGGAAVTGTGCADFSSTWANRGTARVTSAPCCTLNNSRRQV
jgi:hypothetical protein